MMIKDRMKHQSHMAYFIGFGERTHKQPFSQDPWATAFSMFELFSVLKLKK